MDCCGSWTAFSYRGSYYQATDITSQVKAALRLPSASFITVRRRKGRPAAVLVCWVDSSFSTPTAHRCHPDGRNWHVRVRLNGKRGSNPEFASRSFPRVREQIDSTQAPTVGTSLATLTQHHPGLSPRWWACTPLACYPPDRQNHAWFAVCDARLGQNPSDGAVVADFGTVIPARPDIQFQSGKSGRTLNILTGYELTSDGHVSAAVNSTQETTMSFTYTESDGRRVLAFHVPWLALLADIGPRRDAFSEPDFCDC